MRPSRQINAPVMLRLREAIAFPASRSPPTEYFMDSASSIADERINLSRKRENLHDKKLRALVLKIAG